MNKNYDPYKKTILFFFSLISVALMATVFAYFWYRVYWDTMYFFHFYRKGNWALIGLYAILVYFFDDVWGTQNWTAAADGSGVVAVFSYIFSKYCDVFRDLSAGFWACQSGIHDFDAVN